MKNSFKIVYCLSLVIIIGFLFFAPEITQAQRPQYIATSSELVGKFEGQLCFDRLNAPDTMRPRRLQSIYLPSQLQTAPSGYITDIFFRIPRAHNQVISTIHDIKIKLGYTERDSFKRISYTWDSTARDTFISNLTLVHTSDAMTQNSIDSNGRWMRFPLNVHWFHYLPGQGTNLVVEITFGHPYPQNIFCFEDTIRGGGRFRGLSGYADSLSFSLTKLNYYNQNAGSFYNLDFGFNISATANVAQSNFRSFSLSPNPTSNGVFTINLNTKQSAREVTVQVANLTGQELLRQQFQNVGASFSKEIKLQDAAKGVYFVTVVADGEKRVRRLVLE